MERLKHMKEMLMAAVEGEVMNIQRADTEELGEAIDMIKDLSEAIYYCTVTEAMEGKEKEGKKETMYYYPMPMYYREGGGDGDGRRGYRDMDRMDGRMYYSGQGSNSGGNSSGGNRGGNSSSNSSSGSSSRNYSEWEYPYPIDMRDRREGKSPMSRKTYMEAKEMHHGKEMQLKELEKYMHELTDDITEMITESSPEEKQLMQKKIAALAEKVGKVNV